MCVCESDLIKMKLHLITRRYYPGITYNDAILGQFAEALGIRAEREIRDLPEPDQADLATQVYDHLAGAGSAREEVTTRSKAKPTVTA